MEFVKTIHSLWVNGNRKSLCIKWVTTLLALFSIEKGNYEDKTSSKDHSYSHRLL
jgi:hypothetical protein